jgi:hypothetical protein
LVSIGSTIFSTMKQINKIIFHQRKFEWIEYQE